MFNKWKFDRLRKKIQIQRAKVYLLKAAADDYCQSYYTDQYISASLELEELVFKGSKLEAEKIARSKSDE